MNPLLVQFVTAVLRFVLNSVGVWFVAKGILLPNQVEEMTAGLIVSLIALGWSLYSKYRGKLVENTRAAMPAGATLLDAKEMIASGTTARAMTGADERPRLKETT
jgi:hypothetical protein